MVTASDMPVQWTHHAMERWEERFGGDLPYVNAAICEAAVKAGYGFMKIKDQEKTVAVTLKHKCKAVVCTVY